MTIYDGNSIAKLLSSWNCPCFFKQYTISQQSVRYAFDLKSPLDIIKAKKLVKPLEVATGLSASFCDKTTNGHFAIELERVGERKILELKRLGSVMKSLPPFSLLLGNDTENQPVAICLEDMPHLLVAGTTGSGKSVALNTFILELCCYNQQGVGVVLIDLKRNEFCKFEGLPQLLTDVVYDSETAESVLEWLVYEMEQRYIILQQTGTLKDYKKVFVVIDELTDLVMQNPKCKELLVKLLQKSRACGMHIVVATQSPRAKVLDGLMLANLPTRIALTCSNVRESMLILGHKGAENLAGKGDAIVKLPNSVHERHIQIPYISNEDISKIIRGRN